jgi:hypothetical protein
MLFLGGVTCAALCHGACSTTQVQCHSSTACEWLTAPGRTGTEDSERLNSRPGSHTYCSEKAACNTGLVGLPRLCGRVAASEEAHSMLCGMSLVHANTETHSNHNREGNSPESESVRAAVFLPS